MFETTTVRELALPIVALNESLLGVTAWSGPGSANPADPVQGAIAKAPMSTSGAKPLLAGHSLSIMFAFPLPSDFSNVTDDLRFLVGGTIQGLV